MQPLYVDVLLPLSVQNLFTYIVPEIFHPEIAVGKRVIVPFGRKRIYSALIRTVRMEHNDPSSLKEIQSVLDDRTLVNSFQFELWDWMSSYYMCTRGEVMNAAMPATLKLQSETKVVMMEGADMMEGLTANEEIMLDALKKKHELSVEEIASILRKTDVHNILKKAFEKKLIVLSEEINQRYKPKKEIFLRLTEKYKPESELERLFSELEADARKTKQVDTLMIFMKYLFEDPDRDSVKKSILLHHVGISRSSLHSLITNGVLEEFEVITERIPSAGKETIAPLQLSEKQSAALLEIKKSFETQDVCLLHGVTSSGKTEVYIHLMEEIIRSGKQILYLLPEIALTTQLIKRLQKYFGDKVGVYHSRYSNNERVEIWNHVLDFDPALGRNRSQVVLGARSAIFLPYSNLGMVIIDEEHDQSFKQADPAPRYNGRDTAIMLAHLHKAKTILGSATPSLESYYNAENERYGLVQLTERHGGIQMPEVLVANVKEAKRKKIMKSHFTPELLNDLKKALEEKEQVILFQNRRGFSNYIECNNCNWIPHCRNCSVTLTYHKHSNILKCHYCGYAEGVPSVCKECGDFHLEVMGFGTEKIEEEISFYFPDARTSRMDLDSTRTKSSYHRIITDFEERKIDILVGTQMVTKGLDFDNVSTVGIINADQLLNFPDFRSFERSYQLMAQVSGRSGRKKKRGKVIIQTQQPDHWVIRDVVENNYQDFYKRDMYERLKFGYPPHSRLIELFIRHKDNEVVQEASMIFCDLLRVKLGSRVLGPHIPLVSRIRNLNYRNIIIKIEKSSSPSEVKKIIRECMQQFYSDRSNHVVQIYPDVDPF